MKADKLAKELLNYENEDGYDEVFIKEDKLIVRCEGLDNNVIILEGKNYKVGQGMIKKDLLDEILERAVYYSMQGNTVRDLNNFASEVIELIEGSDK